MGKIICDICGTSYQDTADVCPICGYSKDEAAALMSDERILDELLAETPREGQAAPKKKKEIFDFDEANSGKPKKVTVEEVEDSYEEEPEEEPRRQNTFAVILLTILIVVLLAAAGFLFVKFYLPGMGEPETTAPAVTETEASTTMEATTEPTVPCDGLVLVSGTASGDAELTTVGQKFLLNVIATPENTTDVITYVSADESIATVTEDGQVVAVGEGETVINITCGDYQIPCKVVCNFVEETEPPTEAPTEAAQETTESTEPKLKDVTLKVKGVGDYTVAVYRSFQIMLDCGLEQTEVEWTSERPDIASVDKEGNVTANAYGTTSIYVKYGDQTLNCLVRCR